VTADDLDLYARWVLAPDLPRGPVRATSSYFICGVPRSGTWLLAGLLDSTGVAGRPHEWFWRDTEESNRRRWESASLSAYLTRVLEAGTTQNGVFGAKLMWAYHSALLERLRGLTGEPASDHALMERLFPEPRFLHVWREDVRAQASSWAKAIHTGRWHQWDPPAVDVEPDRGQVDALAREARDQNEAWRRWFAVNGIQAFPVGYEDLVADMDGVTREVLAHLGIELPPDVRISPRTVKSA
jgi:LPS sulfotransferase NodH